MECISKYQAYSALRSEAAEHEFPASKEAFERAARIIDQIPAADVREVRRGEWKNHYYDETLGYWSATCSCCEYISSDAFPIVGSHKCCERCGAEMCGGVNNEKTDV